MRNHTAWQAISEYAYEHKIDVFTIGWNSARIGLEVVMREGAEVPDFVPATMKGVPVRWMTFDQAVQEHQSERTTP